MSGRALAAAWASAAVALLAPASASAGGVVAPWLRLHAGSIPASITPGPGAEGNSVVVTAANLGTATLQASAKDPLRVTDVLPAGWTVTGSVAGVKWPTGESGAHGICTGAANTFTCEFTEPIAPYEYLEFGTSVRTPAGPTSTTDEVRVEPWEGPGGPVMTPVYHRDLRVSSEPPAFGVEDYEIWPEGETGAAEAQAGSHPFQLTTQLNFNSFHDHFELEGRPVSMTNTPSPIRDLKIELPPGLVGNSRAVRQCSDAQFSALQPNGFTDECPADTAIGVADAEVVLLNLKGPFPVAVPVFNLVPQKGEPARFGFMAVKTPVTFDTEVRGGDYHVTVNVDETSEIYPIIKSLVTIWGDPGDVRHDVSRGVGCVAGGHDREGDPELEELGCKPPERRATEAFLTMPTWCSGAPLSSTVAALSWESGASFLPPLAATWPEALNNGLSGCGDLDFQPELTVQPTETRSSTPTGLKVLLKVPQARTLEEAGPAEADIRDTTVTLPQGMQLNPSAANGLQACSEAAVGYTGKNPASGTLEFAPEVAKEETEAEQQEREAAGTLCPKASKIGTVRIRTPLLTSQLEGSVFLAEQEHNPFGSLFAIYVVVKDPKTTGVVVKLAGEIQLDGTTGQITNVFANAPQDPFEEFELKTFEGPRASIATPRQCGSYTTQAAFEAWSGGVSSGNGPESGLGFDVASGPNGEPCLESWPFAPALHAGVTSTVAGGLTGFTLTLGRGEGEQAPTNITLKLPPGLAGYLSHVTQCPEPQANEGTCGSGSLIGEARAVSGRGPDPITIEGGKVYITGPYTNPRTGHRSPFGLSVVIPAVAGPFNFGDVVTRSAIDVDPNTAQLTVASELPTMVDAKPAGGGPTRQIGAPVDLQRVEVAIDRANFQFNPTNCSPLAITGSVTGDQGGSAPVDQPFQVDGCESLKFEPKISVETDSRYTRTEGTSLKVIVEARPGEANIHKTKLVFPMQLPSRLTTLQKACLAATFEANPASCPPGSVIGTAIAHTPVLNSPLVGPVYLVSHGGAAFPDAEFVLQGEGITIVLDGKTNIHKGVTSSTFETVPDAPVEKFEVLLPKQPNSAFTGYENLCKPVKTVTSTVVVTKKAGRRRIKVRKRVSVRVHEELVLPTILGGQNGDVIEETTPLKVAHCTAAKGSKSNRAASKADKKKPGHKKP